MEAAARAVPGADRILSVSASVGDTSVERAFVASNGFEGERRGTDHGMSTAVSVADPDGRRPEDWAYGQYFPASCKDCHNDGLFPKMKQGTVKITMEQIYAGKLCGTCHNGKKAFEAKGNCQRCHVPSKK